MALGPYSFTLLQLLQNSPFLLHSLSLCSCRVHIKFIAHPRTPVVSSSLLALASESTADVSMEHRESSTEQLDIAIVDE
jgi:hypothetical protein